LSYLAAAAIVFGLTFLGELPDKSLFASLILGTRYRPLYVWAGAAAAFTVQMAIAVTAGRLLSLLPRNLVDGIVAALFLAGAVYLWISSFHQQRLEGTDEARQGGPPASFLRIAGTSFGVVFLAEWGDITQITAANLAARNNPVAVFVGAVLGLWLIAALAVNLGAKSLDLIPMAWVRRITAAILLALGIYTAVTALAG
jgi:Ca2+/H+ antiporter, TMEM165/GDT1 family